MKREQVITVEELDKRNDRRHNDIMCLHADTMAELRKGNVDKAKFNNLLERLLDKI